MMGCGWSKRVVWRLMWLGKGVNAAWFGGDAAWLGGDGSIDLVVMDDSWNIVYKVYTIPCTVYIPYNIQCIVYTIH